MDHANVIQQRRDGGRDEKLRRQRRALAARPNNVAHDGRHFGIMMRRPFYVPRRRKRKRQNLVKYLMLPRVLHSNKWALDDTQTHGNKSDATLNSNLRLPVYSVQCQRHIAGQCVFVPSCCVLYCSWCTSNLRPLDP